MDQADKKKEAILTVRTQSQDGADSASDPSAPLSAASVSGPASDVSEPPSPRREADTRQRMPKGAVVRCPHEVVHRAVPPPPRSPPVFTCPAHRPRAWPRGRHQ